MVEKEKLLVQERVIGIIRIKIFQNLMGLKFGSSGVGFEESRSFMIFLLSECMVNCFSL